jgi:hypothetical protein
MIAMGRTVRCFFIEKTGLRHITHRMMESLHFRGEAFPEYADTIQRLAYVIIETEDRKLIRIVSANGYDYHFDRQGRLILNREVTNSEPWPLSKQEWEQVEARIWPRRRG